MRTTRQPPKFLTAADFRERYHCSRMWNARHIQHHNFPEPIQFGVGVGIRRRSRLTDIEAWDPERTRINEGVS